MDKKLLSILCCPITHQDLMLATSDRLESINTAIEDGQLYNHDGVLVEKKISEALITSDEKVLYPIRDGIPVLLEGESILLMRNNK
ncbi:uncharacterized protein METZ01_LOCUS3006 [marine metagenome]|uniref:Uncharacterized protein n=1 Tax=marine metagenome TaxID=408172 RepID=A0A381N6D0_9ZZZZ|tara:strand:- start:1489 stop:1746 length:258 start_codon:yes stop_codon:yes gene_type:complete